MKKNLFILLGLLLAISSCTTAEIPLENVEPVVTIVTYDTDVKAIIDNNCISCHVSSGVASFLPLVNYTQVRTSAESGMLIARMNSVVAEAHKFCTQDLILLRTRHWNRLEYNAQLVQKITKTAFTTQKTKAEKIENELLELYQSRTSI